MADWEDQVERDLLIRGRVAKMGKPIADRAMRVRVVDVMGVATHVMPFLHVPEDIEAQNVNVFREDGSMLRLMVLRHGKAAATGGATGVLWVHGGGYVTGIAEMAYMGMPPLMLRERPCVVVCPDYRLASEMPFPGALEDCHVALRWLRDHAEELGVRTDQLFVGGESAGGGLSVALCLYERDLLRAGRDGVRIACHMPLYPMIDDRPTPSSTNNEAPVWDSASNRSSWDLYLEGMDRTNLIPYAAPARETDYRGMPPAISFVGTLDPFLDETVTYIDALQRVGIPTDLRVYRGCYHAFDMFGPSRKGDEARDFFLRAFVRACESYTAAQKT